MEHVIALISGGIVYNLALWDGVAPWIPSGFTEVDVTAVTDTGGSPVQIGASYNGTAFTNPVPPPTITSASTASGTHGQTFSFTVTASYSPTSFASTTLPDGLSINTSTGVISGTPSTAGTSTVQVSAINPTGTGWGTLTLSFA